MKNLREGRMATRRNQPAWRGVVFDGEVWAWPMLMTDHNHAFLAVPFLEQYSCRFRQWTPGGPIAFDPGASYHDVAKVLAWVKAASA